MWAVVNHSGEFFSHFSVSADEDNPICYVTWGEERYAQWWVTKKSAMKVAEKIQRRSFWAGVAVVGDDGATIIQLPI